MIITPLIWIYILSLSLPYGWLIVQALNRLFKQNNDIPFPVQWLLGIVFITTAASFLSLIIPISLIAHLIILAGGIVIFVFWLKKNRQGFSNWFTKVKQTHWLVWILGGLAILTTLEIATRIPTNADTGQYHAQAIRWIETFRVVPGLGNLLTRFAFNSSWFVTNAVFSFAFLGGRSFHLVPGGIFLAAIFYSLSGVSSLLKKDFRLSTIFQSLILPISFAFLPSEVSSPGTDLPIALITWIVIAECLRIFEEGREKNAAAASAIWMIAVFAFTIKLSSAVLLLAGLFMIFSRKDIQWKKFLLWNGLAAVVILLPWLVRNVILSGYLVYPVPFIDFFIFDWKIPLVNAQSDMHAIQNWARLSGRTNPDIDPNMFSSWFPQWWGNLTLIRKGILAVILGLPFVYLGNLLIKKIVKKGFEKADFVYLPVYLFIYLGLVFWFISAPDFRFGSGVLMGAFLLALIPVFIMLLKLFQKYSFVIAILLTVVLIGYQGLTLVRSVETRTLSSRLVFPADYPRLPTEPCKLLNTTVLTPSKDSWSECWYAPFPCTPHCEAGVEMRGESSQDGYRWP